MVFDGHTLIPPVDVLSTVVRNRREIETLRSRRLDRDSCRQILFQDRNIERVGDFSLFVIAIQNADELVPQINLYRGVRLLGLEDFRLLAKVNRRYSCTRVISFSVIFGLLCGFRRDCAPYIPWLRPSSLFCKPRGVDFVAGKLEIR